VLAITLSLTTEEVSTVAGKYSVISIQASFISIANENKLWRTNNRCPRHKGSPSPVISGRFR
jgi:hypothetical protein